MPHPLNLFLSAFLFSHLTRAAEYQPFAPGLPEDAIQDDFGNFGFFRRSDSKCGTSCAGMGENVCCGKKSVCALDQAGNVACCPINAACTGTISVLGEAAITSGGANTAAAPTAAPSGAISHAIKGSSTIANSYYPYPVLPTTYANAGECSSSFSGCQAESAKCTGFIEGGGYGVTIAGGGGGVTQQGAMEPASAEAICSSLSQQACHGLQLSMCSTLGGGSSKPSAAANSFVAGDDSAGAAPTRCFGLYGVGVGMAVGIVGQMVG